MNTQFFSSRFRIHLGRIAIVVFLGYILLNHPPAFLPPFILDTLEIVGLTLLVICAFGRIWCLTYSGGKKNKRLVTEGPYSVSRNPLYIFSFIGTIGLGFVAENPFLSLILAILFAVYYPLVVNKEERKLTSIFGAEYQSYMAKTPRWIPNFSLFAEPTTIEISPRHIRRGIFEALWFVWFFLFWKILEMIRNYYAIR